MRRISSALIGEPSFSSASVPRGEGPDNSLGGKGRSYVLNNRPSGFGVSTNGRERRPERRPTMNRRIVVGVAVVLVALIAAAAIGTSAYRAGVVRGLADAGRLPAPEA